MERGEHEKAAELLTVLESLSKDSKAPAASEAVAAASGPQEELAFTPAEAVCDTH